MTFKCPKNCKNDYQDKKYGLGMRVYTESKKGEKRCTVCGGEARWIVRGREMARNHITKVHG